MFKEYEQDAIDVIKEAEYLINVEDYFDIESAINVAYQTVCPSQTPTGDEIVMMIVREYMYNKWPELTY